MAYQEHWLVRPNPHPGAQVRLFCFPYAGVGPSAFRNWSRELGCDVEVVLVQLPGREGRLRETLHRSIADVVPPLIESMRPLLDRPFALYGHSLGGMVAFETAASIRRDFGLQPAHLFAGASRAPQLPWSHPPLRGVSDEIFLAEVQKRYGGMPQEVISDAEMLSLFLPILRADITMVETYVSIPDKPFDCGITVFGGLEDAMVTRESLEAWQSQTSANFRLQMMPGNHLFLRSARTQLLEVIANELKSVCEKQVALRQDL